MPYPTKAVDNGVNFTSTIHNDTYPAIESVKSNHSNRYVFITGASKGVGRATALSFARAGAAGIALGARSDLSGVESEIQDAAKAAGKKPPRVMRINLDVMSYDSVEAAAKETQKEFGRLDILINNAGYLSAFENITDSNPDEYWRNYETNIRGVYWMTKAFLPLMIQGGEKTIINLSSVAAHMVHPGGSGYRVTKFALLRFTENIVAEYENRGVLAYCVHPGSILTELAKGMPVELHKLLVDTPELAADTMCFLTATRRQWLAGRYVSCNWDMPEFLSRESEIVDGDKLVMRMRF